MNDYCFSVVTAKGKLLSKDLDIKSAQDLARKLIRLGERLVVIVNQNQMNANKFGFN